jgi:hypothetical protein
MQTSDTSEANSRKLDRILLMMEGDGSSIIGFGERMTTVESTLYGKDGQRGLVQEHTILWRAHMWVFGVICAALGSGFTLLVQKVIH